MRIWHVGSSSSPQAVDGVNATVWLVAREQALLGHQVSLLLDTPPDDAALTLAQNVGLELIHIPATTWRYAPKLLSSRLHSTPPQLVHMHSVFVPKQAALAKDLVGNKIPYIITPHAIAPQLLKRGWVKKSFYNYLVEKPRFSAASAITAVMPGEKQAVRAFLPRYQKTVRWVSNPVDTYSLKEYKWKGNIKAKRLVYLGRLDVLHKGIDILINIARWLPEFEVHLYGNEDAKTKGWLQRLKSDLPANVHFHNPVFGVEKAQVLADASLYIQTSRWEVFGLAIAEAMYLGVPCAIADTLNLAELFCQHDLGLVLPSNPQEAATYLKQALAQPERLMDWSKRSQAFATECFQPQSVALAYLKLYEEVLA